jgi:hypothetical protein
MPPSDRAFYVRRLQELASLEAELERLFVSYTLELEASNVQALTMPPGPLYEGVHEHGAAADKRMTQLLAPLRQNMKESRQELEEYLRFE